MNGYFRVVLGTNAIFRSCWVLETYSAKLMAIIVAERNAPLHESFGALD
ncbi:MAG: hypothetical protein WBA41_01925 [Rivularia sp. (in: cyanobacteria)]